MNRKYKKCSSMLINFNKPYKKVANYLYKMYGAYNHNYVAGRQVKHGFYGLGKANGGMRVNYYASDVN